MNEETLRLIFENNPGLLNILLTGVMLPLGILWLTNRHNRKQKETERSLENKFNSKINLRQQEKIVYASLSKILFDVQQLHISISGPCTEDGCITKAVKMFDESVTKYHGDISNNMLYLSSQIINLVYKFYKQMSELKIELMELNERKEFEIAPVSVFYLSQLLADTIIEVQEIFMNERPDLKVPFDKHQQEMMKNVCGIPPSGTLKKKYELFKQNLAEK
ncbi:MAG: hypothetical protein ABI763_04135 [Bacteroidota bacterium]